MWDVTITAYVGDLPAECASRRLQVCQVMHEFTSYLLKHQEHDTQSLNGTVDVLREILVARYVQDDGSRPKAVVSCLRISQPFSLTQVLISLVILASFRGVRSRKVSALGAGLEIMQSHRVNPLISKKIQPRSKWLSCWPNSDRLRLFSEVHRHWSII